MKQKVHLKAKVTFLTREQGGFARSHCSGVKPQLKLRDDLFTSCIVWGTSESQIFEPGVEYNVKLELPSWDHYGKAIYVGMPVQLNEGQRIVGRGTIEAIETP